MNIELCTYTSGIGSRCAGSLDIEGFFDVKQPDRIFSIQFEGKFLVIDQQTKTQAQLTLNLLPPFDVDPSLKELFREAKTLTKVR